ncbi:MAG: 6-carboxytetrahydropterin synthase [bacterium]|jgi:6-pyruvoyltetrahydropterin/6-carboxytetrahydropterin synthase
MAEVVITRVEEFSAAHRLHNPALSDEDNARIYGYCNNPSGHGHNYRLEVSVAGEPDPKTGYLVDLKILRDLIRERIISEVDHKHLNTDVPWLAGIIPSVENLAVAFWERLDGRIPGARLYSIKLFETERNFVTYYGPGGPK